jgi:hypothetical protein
MDANATTLHHIVQHVCVVTFPLHIFTMLPLPLPLGLLLLPLAGKSGSRSNNFLRLLANELGRKNLIVLLS